MGLESRGGGNITAEKTSQGDCRWDAFLVPFEIWHSRRGRGDYNYEYATKTTPWGVCDTNVSHMPLLLQHGV